MIPPDPDGDPSGLPRDDGRAAAAAGPRVVLDTNVLVAYALLPVDVTRRGLSVKHAVELTLARGTLLVSDATLAELREVLRRPGFGRYRSAERREGFLAEIAGRAVRVVPAAVSGLCRDPDDDMFLGAALGGGADWLVTSDRAVLAVRRIGNARIVRPSGFVHALTRLPDGRGTGRR